MLLVICGKMCSGKDTVVKRLINKGFKKIVTYTTRPKRKGETNGVDYHYISKEEFENKIKDGFFLEYRTYKVASGDIWYYGSAKQDILKIRPEQKKVIILRAKRRGDKKPEITRRIEADGIDFSVMDIFAQKIIWNDEGTEVGDVVREILDYVEGEC